jgi:FixJ family two-component response regulator
MSGDSASFVCVVDGDPAVRDSLTTLLNLNGIRVEGFATGAAFLKRLGDGVRMDCIVCEAQLPDVGGIEVYLQLRRTGVPTPFVLLVSNRNPSAIQSARNAGIEQVFPKPLVHRHLLEFISSKSH